MADKSKPTALQLARCGHIAALLRDELTKRGWATSQLCVAMGLKSTATTPYPWLNGTSAPSPIWRIKLSEALGHPVESFVPRDINADRPAPKPFKPATVPAARPRPQRPPVASSEVLGFKVNRYGMAQITLDVVLPLDQAAPLLRLLLDAGLVFGEQETPA